MEDMHMRQWSARNVLVATIVVVAAAPSSSPAQTVYEPSANDPRITAVLETQKRAEDAARRADWKAAEDFFAPDVVVNSPTNRVVALADVMARFRSGQIGAEPGSGERRVEFVGVRGDSVVVMGEETFRPGSNAPNAGKVVRRRFTDIWKQYSGLWKLAIRQATVTAVE
jgi:ketosteroid isomerase-like protein